MQLDKITVAIRPRRAWEGIDLGFAMARRWFRPLLLLWLLSALPLCLLALLIFGGHSWLVLLIIWWFKPLYEPPLLFWMSRALFNEVLPLSQVLRQWPSIVKPQLFANLTWRRFAPNRSFFMSVAILEGLHGKPRRQRCAVLGNDQGTGMALTLIGAHFEAILMLSFLLLMYVLVPEELLWTDLPGLLMAEGRFSEWLQSISELAAMAVIAPFYVAGGFALYLTRRTELEGWDIEINFRRLLARRTKQFRGTLAAGLLACLSIAADFSSPAFAASKEAWIDSAFSALPGHAVVAQNFECPQTEIVHKLPPLFSFLLTLHEQFFQAVTKLDHASARQTIDQVLADSRFGTVETAGYWAYINEPAAEPMDWWEKWQKFFQHLEKFFSELAAVGEFLFWLGVGLLLVLLISALRANRGWLTPFRKNRQQKRAKPITLFGLDLQPDQFPEDILAEVRACLAANELRSALSLLYRGALLRMIHHHDIDVPNSATENECVRLVASTRPISEADYFSRLTRQWLLMAYAHRQPSADKLAELCRDWQMLYQPAHE